MTRFGRKLAIVSAVMLVLCVSPILIYKAVGPEDGNPIGLGLLMFFGWPVFGSLGVVGALLWAVGAIRERRTLPPDQNA